LFCDFVLINRNNYSSLLLIAQNQSKSGEIIFKLSYPGYHSPVSPSIIATITFTRLYTFVNLRVLATSWQKQPGSDSLTGNNSVLNRYKAGIAAE